MQTKQKIYEVAKKLFLEDGLYEVTNKQIAEKANVTHGLIRYYFQNKINIALTVLRENYELVSSCLEESLDWSEDPFLFYITMDNLLNQIKNSDEKLRRFLIDITRERIDFDPNSLNQKYNRALMQMMNDGNKDLEKKYRTFVAIVYGSAQFLQIEMEQGLDLTFDEFFEKMVRLYVFTLDLKWDEEKIQYYINKSKQLSEEVMNAHPQLWDTKNYLYMSQFPERSITEDLLNL